jgi:hypothetical protein
MRDQTPLLLQREKRRKTEFHSPNSAGRSRHGAPARPSHRTPSTKRRLSSPGRPGSPFFPGRRGAIRSHCVSVSRCRAIIQGSPLWKPPVILRS